MINIIVVREEKIDVGVCNALIDRQAAFFLTVTKKCVLNEM